MVRGVSQMSTILHTNIGLLAPAIPTLPEIWVVLLHTEPFVERLFERSQRSL